MNKYNRIPICDYGKQVPIDTFDMHYAYSLSMHTDRTSNIVCQNQTLLTRPDTNK